MEVVGIVTVVLALVFTVWAVWVSWSLGVVIIRARRRSRREADRQWREMTVERGRQS